MMNILVYAASASTRQLYQRKLAHVGLTVYRAKDASEAILSLVTFDIDTIVLVDEGVQQHQIDIFVALCKKKFDDKRFIYVSPVIRQSQLETYRSSNDFFDALI